MSSVKDLKEGISKNTNRNEMMKIFQDTKIDMESLKEIQIEIKKLGCEEPNAFLS